jgi:hypothetical protein
MLNGVNTVIDRKFGEYINSFTMAIRGKSKYIDCLYLVRNVHDRIDHSSYYRWISSKRWHSSWDSLHKEISNTLMQKDLISKDTSLQYTKEYIESIMDFRDRVNKNCNYKTLLRNLVKRKELLIPYKKIRAIIYKMLIIFSSKNKLRFDNVSSKSSIYYSDFTPIFNSVKVYPALNDNNKNTI